MNKFLGLAIGLASLSAAEAATITVTAGFNAATAITVLNPTFNVAVGSWDGSNFIQFGQSVADTGTVNGSFTASTPAEVNSDVLFVWVGIGAVSTSGGGQFALFRTSGNTTFPADVSNPLGSATFAMHNTTPGTVVFVTGSNAQLTGNTLNFVPEPSSALLGALGVVGLLRRRRANRGYLVVV